MSYMHVQLFCTGEFRTIIMLPGLLLNVCLQHFCKMFLSPQLIINWCQEEFNLGNISLMEDHRLVSDGMSFDT